MRIFLLTHVVSGSLVFPPEVLKETYRLLADSCGGECVNTFNQLLPEIEKLVQNSSDIKPFLRKFDSQRKYDLSQVFKETENLRTHMSSVFAATQEADATTSFAKQDSSGASVLPCETQQECNALEEKLNKCTTTKESILETYEAVNQIVGSLAMILKGSCLCAFQGPLTVCGLAGFPYTCSAWFQMYRGVFMMSMGIWNSGVSVSQTCMIPLS